MIYLFHGDFNKVTLFTNQIDIVAVDLDKIIIDYGNSFDEDDPETIIYVRLLAWCSKFKKRKSLRKR